jgi:hypothetical protein
VQRGDLGGIEPDADRGGSAHGSAQAPRSPSMARRWATR